MLCWCRGPPPKKTKKESKKNPQKEPGGQDLRRPRRRPVFCPSCLAAFSALEWEPLRMQGSPELPTSTPRAWFLLWAERFAISRAASCYDSKRTLPPCDCRIEIAFESKETNSSAPSHSPS